MMANFWRRILLLAVTVVFVAVGQVCWSDMPPRSQVEIGFWWGATTNVVPQKELMTVLFKRCKIKVVDGLFREAKEVPAEAGTPWSLVSLDITAAWWCGDVEPLVMVRLDPDDWRTAKPKQMRLAVASLMKRLVGLPNLAPVDLEERWAAFGGYDYWQKEEAWKAFLLRHSAFISKALWLDIRRLMPERVLVSPAHLQSVINSCLWRLVVFILLFPVYVAVVFLVVWLAVKTLWPNQRIFMNK